ncbi:MAG: hypothetical protein IJS93_00960 [Clostridia bacterium]|nr:hypothetical protein [Clostridia bacterium]
MDDFLIRFNEATNNKYSYLRIKRVDIFKSERKACIYFYVPEKIYERGFDNTVQKELGKFCQKIARNMKCEFYFERLLVSESICKENVEEFCLSRYPFLTSSINADCIKVEIRDEIKVFITIEEDVFNVIEQSDFAEKLVYYLQETYILPTSIEFNVVKKGVIKIETEELGVKTKKTVPIKGFEYLCGVNAKTINFPVFIDSVKRAADNATICGVVDEYHFKENEKPEDENKFYRKYSYRLVLNDLTEKMTVYFSTNDEKCPLKDVTVGKEILARGKILYSVIKGAFVMYAKSVYTCKLDVEKIKEAIKPLPPPETMEKEPEPYVGGDFLLEQRLEDLDKEYEPKEFDAVFFAYNLVNPKSFSPWEITMLSFEKGKCKEVYNTFVRTSNIEAIDPEFKAKVNVAKRLSDLVGDILCFTKGKQFICQNPSFVVPEIAALCKPQRYEFAPEAFDADKIGMKVSKGEQDLRKNLKLHGIALKSERTYDLAIAMAKLYLKVLK